MYANQLMEQVPQTPWNPEYIWQFLIELQFQGQPTYLVKNTETSGVYCMNPHQELIIHIKDTVIQYPYIVPVSSHIPTYVPSMIPNT